MKKIKAIWGIIFGKPTTYKITYSPIRTLDGKNFEKRDDWDVSYDGISITKFNPQDLKDKEITMLKEDNEYTCSECGCTITEQDINNNKRRLNANSRSLFKERDLY